MTTKQELEQQLKTAQQKLSGKIPLEEWETTEGIKTHIQDLEQQLANLNMSEAEKLKQKLGANTEKIENKVGEYYFKLEPYQRGALVIGLIILLILFIYWLTKGDKNRLAEKEARREAQMEEKWLKQMALLKKFKE